MFSSPQPKADAAASAAADVERKKRQEKKDRLQEIQDVVQESKKLSVQAKQSAFLVLCEEDVSSQNVPKLRSLSMDSMESDENSSSYPDSPSSSLGEGLSDITDKDLMNQIQQLEKETSSPKKKKREIRKKQYKLSDVVKAKKFGPTFSSGATKEFGERIAIVTSSVMAKELEQHMGSKEPTIDTSTSPSSTKEFGEQQRRGNEGWTQDKYLMTIRTTDHPHEKERKVQLEKQMQKQLLQVATEAASQQQTPSSLSSLKRESIPTVPTNKKIEAQSSHPKEFTSRSLGSSVLDPTNTTANKAQVDAVNNSRAAAAATQPVAIIPKEFKEHEIAESTKRDITLQNNALEKAMERRKAKQGIVSWLFDY